MAAQAIDSTFALSVGYHRTMSNAPTARERISAVASENGWTFAPVGGGPKTVIDLITRGDDVALVTWNAEGTAALSIQVGTDGARLFPIKAARHGGLIALREVLETPQPADEATVRRALGLDEVSA